ncbi:MAG: hypothetical protein A3B38_00900 [Candidatus Levybacteria bacterium RIFCSPLOWO2_01_FULL_36_13]|nr:MAG: hypothetical protein A2684_02140 [Candidatus Levybacteria bacterium RIFCSPHIGHO2_01_FULL_36_15b]OGH35446.1 MAG: hypothetical protein A3B38_00900 [Candidatus Levybacteria bacterium RIFCSPLOWO2_01_FULL_36_13]
MILINFVILIVCFFIFLYNLYFVSKEDILLIRRDILINKIFNLAILSAIASLFFARLFYILSYPNQIFNSLLGFVAFTYHPGLSLMGAIAGGLLFISLYSKYKNYPIGRILDLFTVSLLGVLPIVYILIFIASLGKTDTVFNIFLIISFIISLVFIKGVYKLSEKGELKDGSFSLIFLTVFSLLYFLIMLFSNLEDFSFLKVENLLSFVVIFLSIGLLVNQEVMNKFLSKK